MVVLPLFFNLFLWDIFTSATPLTTNECDETFFAVLTTINEIAGYPPKDKSSTKQTDYHIE
jgi:hypothetical protein